MKVFALDDFVLEVPEYVELTQVVRPEDFQRAIPTFAQYDEVWLDHDLQGGRWDGAAAVKLLIEHGASRVPTYRVITMNAARGSYMVDELRHSDYIAAWTPISSMEGVDRGWDFLDPTFALENFR